MDTRAHVENVKSLIRCPMDGDCASSQDSGIYRGVTWANAGKHVTDRESLKIGKRGEMMMGLDPTPILLSCTYK